MGTDWIDRAPRFPAANRVTFSTGDTEGSGRLANLSETGALIRESTQRLYPGIKIRVRIEEGAGEGSVELQAAVVRETDDGFAVRFLQVAPELARILAEAARGLGTA